MCSAFDASEAIDLSSCQAKIVALTHSLVSRVLVLHGAFIDTPPPDNEQDSCVVCLASLHATREAWSEETQGGEELGRTAEFIQKPLTKLPCGHIFHSGCVVPWLAAVVPQAPSLAFLSRRQMGLRLTCPLCMETLEIPECLKEEWDSLLCVIDEENKRRQGQQRGPTPSSTTSIETILVNPAPP